MGLGHKPPLFMSGFWRSNRPNTEADKHTHRERQRHKVRDHKDKALEEE